MKTGKRDEGSGKRKDALTRKTNRGKFEKNGTTGVVTFRLRPSVFSLTLGGTGYGQHTKRTSLHADP